MTPDQAEVLDVLRRQEAAIARGDAKAAVEPMASDVVLYDLPPPLEHRGSREQGERALAEWIASWEGGVVTVLAKPTVLVDGDLAVVFGLSRMRGVKKGEGTVDQWNRRTIVLRRDLQKHWRIVHEHSSYPLRMDGSGKAALDLQPSDERTEKQGTPFPEQRQENTKLARNRTFVVRSIRRYVMRGRAGSQSRGTGQRRHSATKVSDTPPPQQPKTIAVRVLSLPLRFGPRFEAPNRA